MTPEEWENVREYGRKVRESKQKYKIHYDMSQPEYYDKPGTMDNVLATVLYIIVVVGGLILKDFLYIWAFSTYIYYSHITRHKRK